MALLRFGQVPRGRAFVPLFLGLMYVGVLTALICVYAPHLLPSRPLVIKRSLP